MCKDALLGGSGGGGGRHVHPCFSVLPGEEKKIVHAFYFPRNSLPRAPLLSRPDGRLYICAIL